MRNVDLVQTPKSTANHLPINERLCAITHTFWTRPDRGEKGLEPIEFMRSVFRAFL